MSVDIIARRYAEALLSLGKKGGDAEIDRYADDLAAITEAEKQSPELAIFLKNPAFSNAEKRAVLAPVLEKLGVSPIVRNFCMLLAEKERLGALPQIARAYSDLRDAANGIIRGELLTAIELTPEKKTAVNSQLERQSQKKIALTYAVDRNILGGVVLKVGDMVLDASLKAQLNILKETIKRGE